MKVWHNTLLLLREGRVQYWLDLKTGKRFPFVGGGTHLTFTPAVNAFRFYEDGTESGSTPIANQDTNINRNVDVNSKVHLRYRVQETGGADGASTDDYQLQVSINGGGFNNVSPSSTGARADSASSLTGESASTNRATNGITDGSGSFVAGEQSESGIVTDRQLTGSNFTEHVWALLLIASDLSNNDVLQFRISLNGGNPGITNSVTPQITANKSQVQAPRSMHQFRLRRVA